MMNEMLSANSPHATRLAWNIDTHTAIATNQIAEPMADKITSAREEVVSHRKRLSVCETYIS